METPLLKMESFLLFFCRETFTSFRSLQEFGELMVLPLLFSLTGLDFSQAGNYFF